MRFRSTNPFIKRANTNALHMEGIDYVAATYTGIAGKSLYFIVMVLLGAFGGIFLLASNPEALITALPITAIAAFVFGLIAFMAPTTTKYTGTIYCLLQGMMVGVISLIFETMLPGVVVTALMGTVAVVFTVAMLYMTGLVKVTGTFVRFLMIFAISMIVCHLLVFILSIASPAFAAIYASPGFVILSSVVMILLASMYLMFDMELIRQIVEGGQPKATEWYASFGLIFTIVWLYMQVLRLVAILMANRS